MAQKAALTARDWVLGAARVLAAEGISGVRVERLARDLGATKGSFYWHFANLAALHDALLSLWEEEGTKGVIVEARAQPTPRARLEKTVALAMAASVHGIESAAMEVGLRDWARRAPDVARRIAAIETRRVGFLQDLLVEIGWPTAQAARKAAQLYMAFAGLEALAGHAPHLADRAALTALVAEFCVPPAAA